MTTISIDLPETVTIPLGRDSIYGTLTVEWTRFPMNALQYIAAYGLKQVINDAMATKVDKDGNALDGDEIAAKAEAKLDALYEGTLRMRGESVAVDEYEAEAVRMAKRHIIKGFTKSGLMRDIPKGTEDRMMFALNRHLISLDKPEMTEGEYMAVFFGTPTGKVIIRQAREAVDARRTLGNDLDDLLPDTNA